MKRIIICGNYNFPRGSAASNYVQYLTMALLKAGFQVVLLSNINQSENDYLGKLLSKYKGRLDIREFRLSNYRLLHYIQYKYFLQHKFEQALKSLNINKTDIILCYSSNSKVHRATLRFSSKHDILCGATVVEWYPKEYFGKNVLGEHEYRDMFENLFPQYDFLFPISTYIEAYFKKQNCKTMCLPIMADPDEYEYLPSKKKVIDKTIIVYPANGRMKDALTEMCYSICKLNDEELANLQFHITGVKKGDIISILGEEDFQRIENSLVIHPWLNYDQLIELYQKSSFLLLARAKNQLTMANFPSKVPETMTYGVIPIASRVGDYTKYYLEHKQNAIIIEGYKSDDIVVALRMAINMEWTEKKRLSDAARKTVEDKFSYVVWADHLNAFFSRVIKERI